MISEQRIYVQSVGGQADRFINGRTERKKEPSIGDVGLPVVSTETYSATGIVPLVNEMGQQMQGNVNFPVPGETIEQAFENFDQAFKACVEETVASLRRQAMEKQIIVPGAAVPRQAIERTRKAFEG